MCFVCGVDLMDFVDGMDGGKGQQPLVFGLGELFLLRCLYSGMIRF